MAGVIQAEGGHTQTSGRQGGIVMLAAVRVPIMLQHQTKPCLGFGLGLGLGLGLDLCADHGVSG
jgi:hypothetical protein